MSTTIFHKIINKEIPAKIEYEDEFCIAIHDINPVAPTHLLIIPKSTIACISNATTEHQNVLGHLLLVANQLAKERNLESSGYRLVINNGEAAGQTVFQLHIHLLGGRDFTWPPG
ncbi:MAG: histidine triad nucleotide-binding protein [Proteobacteria bacterium]|nr:histidine triad nucleotide-binding protein [Pseudomonadota bacterium]